MLDRTIPPLVKPMSFTFRKPVKRVLRNGIPIYVIEGEEQNVVRVDFVLSAGQWHQAQKLQALFTCRMLREGCHGYSTAAFAERLDYYGAWLELSVAMNRTFVMLYTLKKFFAQTLELVQKMLFEPSFSDEQFELVRANNKAQFAVNMLKGDIRAVRALRRSVYGDSHPCGMQILPDDYDMLQSAHLTDFYSRYYGSCNCSIYVSGNIDEEVMGLIELLFGIAPWGSGQAVPNRIYSVNPSEERRVVLVQPDAVQSSLRMGGLMMDVSDEDYLPMRVLTTLLGGYFGSRLMKTIRESKGYTYHISSDLVTNTSQVLFMVSCEALAGKDEEVVAAVGDEMRRLQEELVSEEELHVVRSYMTGEICRNYEGAFSLTDAYIFMEHLGLPDRHLEQTIEAIHTTDAAYLQQLAQRYLCPEAMHVAIVRP